MSDAAVLPQLSLPPSKIRRDLVRAMMSGLVPSVRSSPGMGKSEIVQSIAKEYRLFLIDFRLSQCDVTDLNGLPKFTEDGRAYYAPFNTFPLEGDELPDHPDGGKYDGWLLFFDEITSAGKQLQAASYKIILDKMVGQRKLHPRVKMMCAGNLKSDNAVVIGMSTALQSRMVHLIMHTDHKEWMQWAVDNKVDSRILGFLEFQPDYLHKFDPNHTDATFACPRTWWFAHRLINGEPVDIADIPLLAGTVSSGIAQEFVQFCKIYADLPKMADVLAHPNSAPIPSEPSTKFAMATVIADNFDAKNAKELVTYLRRYDMAFQIIALRIAHRKNPALVRLPDVTDLWADIIPHM